MTAEIDRDALRALAPAGFHVALRVGFAFPQHELNALPPSWVETYTRSRYMLFDPAIQWVYSNTGAARWSAIDRPDPRGVLKDAAEHGLSYGVAVSVTESPTDAFRSFGSFCRSDREFTDEEIAHFEHLLAGYHKSLTPPSNLTVAELEALRMISEGLRVKQIAFELQVSEGAIKQRLRNAKRKLGAQTGAQAAARANEFGLF